MGCCTFPHRGIIIKRNLQFFIINEKELRAQRQTMAEALWDCKHLDWEAVLMEPVRAFWLNWVLIPCYETCISNPSDGIIR